MKKIFCDIDSTINDHWRRIRRNTIPRWPGEGIHPKAFARDEVMQDKLATTFEYKSGGMLFGKTIRSLEDSFEISFLSARGWKKARIITEEWLKRYEINYKKLLLVPTMEAKIKILTIQQPDYYIDDFMTGQERAIPTFRSDIAERIQALGIKVIVFRNDWADVIEQLSYYEDAVPIDNQLKDDIG